MDNVTDVSIYGVKLDGYDGQMGAAGVTLSSQSPEVEAKFVSELFSFCKARGLPNYALPRLVRLTKQIDINATFKHSKEVLKKRSWNPEQNTDNDRLFWLDGETYKALDPQSWVKITTVKARL
ncbi:Isopenicillin N epimerase component 1 [Phlyctema vagabunda]|uniref:Isopenicillin N epimerase component 1 n=1 Tax=Phlyctema vagabunda TaxID=108571 RepID=A0ABR4PTY5_9HELO